MNICASGLGGTGGAGGTAGLYPGQVPGGIIQAIEFNKKKTYF